MDPREQFGRRLHDLLEPADHDAVGRHPPRPGVEDGGMIPPSTDPRFGESPQPGCIVDRGRILPVDLDRVHHDLTPGPFDGVPHQVDHAYGRHHPGDELDPVVREDRVSRRDLAREPGPGRPEDPGVLGERAMKIPIEVVTFLLLGKEYRRMFPQACVQPGRPRLLRPDSEERGKAPGSHRAEALQPLLHGRSNPQQRFTRHHRPPRSGALEPVRRPPAIGRRHRGSPPCRSTR